MAKVTVTFEDTDAGTVIDFNFDPKLERQPGQSELREEDMTEAQRMGYQLALSLEADSSCRMTHVE